MTAHKGATMTTRSDYQFLDIALSGEVVPSIGQLTKADRFLLDQAVRAGKIRKWRGKWFPHTGAAFGIGPDKTCYGTPAALADIESLNACMRRGA